jgi:hypothetical protein
MLTFRGQALGVWLFGLAFALRLAILPGFLLYVRRRIGL